MINNPWNFDYNLDREEQRVDIIFTDGIVDGMLKVDFLVALSITNDAFLPPIYKKIYVNVTYMCSISANLLGYRKYALKLGRIGSVYSTGIGE